MFSIAKNLKGLFIIIKISCFYYNQNSLNSHHVDYRQFYCNVKVHKILSSCYYKGVHMNCFYKNYGLCKLFCYARVMVCVTHRNSKQHWLWKTKQKWCFHFFMNATLWTYGILHIHAFGLLGHDKSNKIGDCIFWPM